LEEFTANDVRRKKIAYLPCHVPPGHGSWEKLSPEDPNFKRWLHTFHVRCLKDWWSRPTGLICPMCKKAHVRSRLQNTAARVALPAMWRSWAFVQRVQQIGWEEPLIMVCTTHFLYSHLYMSPLRPYLPGHERFGAFLLAAGSRIFPSGPVSPLSNPS
jgi:hypothetical protein